MLLRSQLYLCVCVQAKHTQDNSVCWGVDGESGCLSDMSALGIWEPLAVKAQTYKTAVEVRISHTAVHPDVWLISMITDQ